MFGPSLAGAASRIEFDAKLLSHQSSAMAVVVETRLAFTMTTFRERYGDFERIAPDKVQTQHDGRQFAVMQIVVGGVAQDMVFVNREPAQSVTCVVSTFEPQ